MAGEEVKIRKARNGYIIRCGPYTEEEVFTNIGEMFPELLLFFESKGIYLGGENYGRVIMDYDSRNSEGDLA